MWYRDYAGGGNVHAVGGMAALVGAIFIGPRIGRFEKVIIFSSVTKKVTAGGFIALYSGPKWQNPKVPHSGPFDAIDLFWRIHPDYWLSINGTWLW